MKRLFWLMFSVATGMIGYAIHHSLFWAICDFVFLPLAWAKWLICHEVSMSVIKSAFAFLGQ